MRSGQTIAYVEEYRQLSLKAQQRIDDESAEAEAKDAELLRQAELLADGEAESNLSNQSEDEDISDIESDVLTVMYSHYPNLAEKISAKIEGKTAELKSTERTVASRNLHSKFFFYLESEKTTTSSTSVPLASVPQPVDFEVKSEDSSSTYPSSSNLSRTPSNVSSTAPSTSTSIELSSSPPSMVMSDSLSEEPSVMSQELKADSETLKLAVSRAEDFYIDLATRVTGEHHRQFSLLKQSRPENYVSALAEEFTAWAKKKGKSWPKAVQFLNEPGNQGDHHFARLIGLILRYAYFLQPEKELIRLQLVLTHLRVPQKYLEQAIKAKEHSATDSHMHNLLIELKKKQDKKLYIQQTVSPKAILREMKDFHTALPENNGAIALVKNLFSNTEDAFDRILHNHQSRLPAEDIELFELLLNNWIKSKSGKKNAQFFQASSSMYQLMSSVGLKILKDDLTDNHFARLIGQVLCYLYSTQMPLLREQTTLHENLKKLALPPSYVTPAMAIQFPFIDLMFKKLGFIVAAPAVKPMAPQSTSVGFKLI